MAHQGRRQSVSRTKASNYRAVADNFTAGGEIYSSRDIEVLWKHLERYRKWALRMLDV